MKALQIFVFCYVTFKFNKGIWFKIPISSNPKVHVDL